MTHEIERIKSQASFAQTFGSSHFLAQVTFWLNVWLKSLFGKYTLIEAFWGGHPDEAFWGGHPDRGLLGRTP